MKPMYIFFKVYKLLNTNLAYGGPVTLRLGMGGRETSLLSAFQNLPP